MAPGSRPGTRMGGQGKLTEFLQARIEAGDLPGASYLVAVEDTVLVEGVLGHAVLEPRRVEARRDTLYDLSSLTKPLATALLLAQLQSGGRLELDDELSRHLPSWRAPGSDERAATTLLDLLTHRAGLPAWKPLYAHAEDREGRVEWLLRVPLEYPPRRGVVYSDLGYILLGFALEEITGTPLDRLFADRVARPLGLEDLLYRPDAVRGSRIAATETGNMRERELAGEEGRGYNGWRTGVIWGEVHDHNARTLGGVAGHAGLFGTARAVWTLARQFLDGGSPVVPSDQRALFRTGLTSGLGQDRAVGFQLASTPGCSAGDAFSARAFGHVGFTGTSLWIDPDAGRICVLLTNRVHPRFRPIDMNAVRREFHRIAATV
jgi:CubicO group peptidase (beta-lactamase class C family)